MSDRRKTFRIEKLEDRQMMAGDIAVQFSNGTLSIMEAQGHAGENNSVAVSMMPNGNLRVLGTGVDQEFNPALIEDVDINLGGGSDTLLFNADLTEPGIPNFRTHVYINMGTTDPFDFGHVDQVEITGSDIQGLVQIETGWATDLVLVNGTTIMGDGLLINTSSGSDTVEVVDCDLGGLAIQTYAGQGSEWHVDQVEIRYINVDIDPMTSVRVALGGGDDIFHLEDINAAYIDIDAGLDNDTGTLVDVGAVDEVMARMGDGNDSLVLRRVVTDRLTALGEGGTNDRLTTRDGMTNTNTYNTSTIIGWENINGTRQFTLWNETPTTNKMVKRRVVIG